MLQRVVVPVAGGGVPANAGISEDARFAGDVVEAAAAATLVGRPLPEAPAASAAQDVDMSYAQEPQRGAISVGPAPILYPYSPIVDQRTRLKKLRAATYGTKAHLWARLQQADATAARECELAEFSGNYPRRLLRSAHLTRWLWRRARTPRRQWSVKSTLRHIFLRNLGVRIASCVWPKGTAID